MSIRAREHNAATNSLESGAGVEDGGAMEEEEKYNPKTKEVRLSFCEKLVIVCGTLFVVFLMVLVRHPELYKGRAAEGGGEDGLLLNAAQMTPTLSASEAAIGEVLLSASKHHHHDGSKKHTTKKVHGSSEGGGGTTTHGIKGWCTHSGTLDYSVKFVSGKGHFGRSMGAENLLLSKIGIGTYLGEPTEATAKLVEDAVCLAVLSGVNVIDTAINYLGQKSERAIGHALRRLIGKEQLVVRENLFIATKAGFIPSDSDKSTSPRMMIADWTSAYALKHKDSAGGEMFPSDEIIGGKHCISPACLDASIDLSLANLGISTIDLVYLHNVEKQLENVSLVKLMERLERAFEHLESLRAKKKIRMYGLATWQAFRVDEGHKSFMSLADVVQVAQKVGGVDHGFRFIQLPLSLSMPEARSLTNQPGSVSALQSAAGFNISVMTSRSVAAAKEDLMDATAKHFSECSPPGDTSASGLGGASLSLHLVRGIEGVTTALVGMKQREHVLENVKVLKLPLPSEELIECVEKATKGDKETAARGKESTKGGKGSRLRHKEIKAGTREKKAVGPAT